MFGPALACKKIEVFFIHNFTNGKRFDVVFWWFFFSENTFEDSKNAPIVTYNTSKDSFSALVGTLDEAFFFWVMIWKRKSENFKKWSRMTWNFCTSLRRVLFIIFEILMDFDNFWTIYWAFKFCNLSIFAVVVLKNV